MNCLNGNCEVTQSADYQEIKPLPWPRYEDYNTPLFEDIWKALYGKRLECPEYYTGWQVATGRHVRLILDMIKEAKNEGNAIPGAVRKGN